MTDKDEIQLLLAPVEAAFRAEFSRGHAAGYAEGYKAAVAALMQTAQNLSPFPASADSPPSIFEMGGGTIYRSTAGDPNLLPPSRAPKGVLDQVLVKMLTESPGMTTQEAEVAAVAIDSRIAVKSVYNRLRHFEKSGRKFRRVDGKWYRIEDIPPPWAGKATTQEKLIERLGSRQGVPDNA